MTAVFCRAAADRKAATWDERLAPFTRLEFAVSDGAKGIAAAVARRAAERRDDPAAPPLEHGLDVFHTAMEARRVLARHWRRAEAAWEKAEGAEAELAGAKRQGIDARGPAHAASAAWGRAAVALGEAERLESAWGRAAAALEVFDADGRLNDRAGLGRDRRGAEGPRRVRVVEGPQRADRPAGPGLPRPDASSVECGRAATGVAGGDGLAVVAAARPTRPGGSAHGVPAGRRPGPRVG